MTVDDVKPNIMIGASAGLNLRNDGGLGMPGGNSGIAAAIAVCTSTAAPSRSRSSENVSVICVLPVELLEIIESRPAMVVNWRSSGVATAEAIVSGFAPGSPADTFKVGKSTLGRSETDNWPYAMAPKTASASMRRLVATGR